jgi:peroxiredoxin
MTTTAKLAAGALFPSMTVPRAGGGQLRLGDAGGWQAVIVYRGRHCPLCKTYLKRLDALKEEY